MDRYGRIVVMEDVSFEVMVVSSSIDGAGPGQTVTGIRFHDKGIGVTCSGRHGWDSRFRSAPVRESIVD
jgi:hypothetical protein